MSRLQPSLSNTVTETLIHGFISNRLDYCDGVLFGIPSKTLDRLQYVQNSAARVLTHTKPWQHITPTLIHLHWLPVKYHISYKLLLLLTCKSLNSLAPPVTFGPPPPTHTFPKPAVLGLGAALRPPAPADAISETEPSAWRPPTLWNSLLSEIRSPPTLDSFISDSLMIFIYNNEGVMTRVVTVELQNTFWSVVFFSKRFVIMEQKTQP